MSNSATPWTVYSPPGSSVHGISQAIILEWVVISFSSGSSGPRDWTASPETTALQADSYHWAIGKALWTVIHHESIRIQKIYFQGTFLVVQWLRLTLRAGRWVRSRVRELRSHVPCHAVWLKNELEYRKYRTWLIYREILEVDSIVTNLGFAWFKKIVFYLLR